MTYPYPITAYMLIQNDDPQKLVDDVNDYIMKGWQPLGGVSHRNTQISGHEYCQALIRHAGMRNAEHD